ncbi:hypothetical protein SAMN05518672_10332 [Chitinophaga sp. CF118]|uniref:hypothetical protein n=1 Tax=Chitinophaga sp. CF118 TaxID=1884367 RepID=UPI0008F41B49|nr:hypothetical protein [Chitinophaga sp. CF118]SFD74402.1 hypothetical protein SAMN05518672_10332 [Chitinophaga sp. CF118]
MKKIVITLCILVIIIKLFPAKAQSGKFQNVQAAALLAMSETDPAEAVIMAKMYEKDSKGALADAIFTIYTTGGGNPEWPYVYKTFKNKSAQQQFSLSEKFGDLTGHVKNPEYVQQGIEALKDLGIVYRENDTEEKIVAILTLISTNRSDDPDCVKAVEMAITAIHDTK